MTLSTASKKLSELEDGMDEDVKNILSGKAAQLPREYHVIVSHHTHSAHYSGNINFSMRANSVADVRHVTEGRYPAPEYSIVQIKPVR